MARDDFSAASIRILAARAGYRCSNPGCRKPTSGPQDDPAKTINIGVAAHITAAAPGGPRYDPRLSTEERSAIDNAIWLCQSCAKLIDSDESRYGVQLLHTWKADAEQAAIDSLEGGEPSQPASGGDVVSAQVGSGAQHVAVGKNIRQIGTLIQVQGGYAQTRPAEIDPKTLAAAEGRLAALPLDAIPPVAPLPPGSRVPFRRNPLFVGREDDLKTLAKALKGGETAAIGQIAAATGLGGIGKTQLAAEFAHRYGQYFAGGVFWLSFADPAAVPAEVAACGGPGALDLRPDFEALDLETQVRLVLSAWGSAMPRLLVFDNCEAEDLLARWRPPSGGARVGVTSRRASWDPALGVAALALGVLSREESVALLRKFRPDLEDGEADASAAELGDLPLALHLAGSFLHAYRHSSLGEPEAYLAQLRDPAVLERLALAGQEARFSPTGHELDVARTFARSYERLDAADARDALACALLARAACLAPGEPIPRALLLATAQVDSEDFDATRQAEGALARLGALGLLESQADGALVLPPAGRLRGGRHPGP